MNGCFCKEAGELLGSLPCSVCNGGPQATWESSATAPLRRALLWEGCISVYFLPGHCCTASGGRSGDASVSAPLSQDLAPSVEAHPGRFLPDSCAGSCSLSGKLQGGVLGPPSALAKLCVPKAVL